MKIRFISRPDILSCTLSDARIFMRPQDISANAKISQARELAVEGKARDALMVIGLALNAFVEQGDKETATIYLKEAVQVFKQARDHDLFKYTLRLLENCSRLVEKDETRSHLAEIGGFLDRLPDPYRRDEIRLPMLLILRAIGDMPGAQEIAGQIEGEVSRFDVFHRLAKWSAQDGKIEQARAILLGPCLEMAKKPDHFH